MARRKPIIGLIATLIVALVVASHRETPTRIRHRRLDLGEMVYVPAGVLRVRGRTYDLPAFYVDRFEVTEAQWDAYVRRRGLPALPFSPWSRRNRDYPVRFVTFSEAEAYARDQLKELPDNLQWERASRGKGGSAFPWGDAYLPAANTLEIWDGQGKAIGVTRVATFDLGCSEVGAYDMIGNVREWTRSERGDGLHARFNASTIEFAGAGGYRIARGGSFDTAIRGTSGLEDLESIHTRSWDLGFRCVVAAAEYQRQQETFAWVADLGHRFPPFSWWRVHRAEAALEAMGPAILTYLDLVLESDMPDWLRERIEGVARTIRSKT